MKVLKYIITQDNEPILFSTKIVHNTVSSIAIRAGFACILFNDKDAKFEVSCFGESLSLNLQ